MPYKKFEDGTIVDNDGNVVFFSLERFKKQICIDHHCFLCGASSKDKEFNDEHIIPKWILRKLNLFKKTITLPNNVKLKYERYTVPCCKECNSKLGLLIEEPIRKIFDKKLSIPNNYLDEDECWKLFLWLCLVFFKTHFKDSFLRRHLDKRMGDEAIDSEYDWASMHHIHCMLRSIVTGIEINKKCLGSMIIWEAKESENYDNFDYRDFYLANSILIRIGNVAILSVLDDSSAALYFVSNIIDKIDGPLSPIQLRELLAHFTYVNLHLKYRPNYFTVTNSIENKVTIDVELPSTMEMEEFSREEYGEILYQSTKEYIKNMKTNDQDFNVDNIRGGLYRFILDQNDIFISNSMEIVTGD